MIAEIYHNPYYNRMNSYTDNHEISKMVATISRQFNPERIILFGSYARGTATYNSDVDLMVVMPVKGSVRRAAVDIDRALLNRSIPVDILVVTPEQFAAGKDSVGSVIRPAVKDGKVLFSRTVE